MGIPNGPVFLCDNVGSTCDSQADKGISFKETAQGDYSFPQKLSSVEFPITFSQFLLNLDCESICDPPGG